MRVLVVNAGSSSLKLSLVDQEGRVAAEGGASSTVVGPPAASGGRPAALERSSPEVMSRSRSAMGNLGSSPEKPNCEAKVEVGPYGAVSEPVEPLAERELRVEGDRVPLDSLREALEGPLSGAEAVGHRIVHGGERFHGPVRIDPEVEAALRDLSDLAPLHQAKSLAALDAVSEQLPGLPAVACFDTAFHASMPKAASTYALPQRWRERWAVRRYGFHGLSHSWVASRAPEVLSAQRRQAGALQRGELGLSSAAPLRIVSCHLGAGASLCAISGGTSLDTTMGFTPLEGLVMATRSGSVDPGLVLWLMERTGLSEREIAHALEHESGLLGLGGSADMRAILSGARRGERDETLALGVYLHRLRAGIAAMAASLGGIDVLAFTGGVGERSAALRQAAAAGLSFLGVELSREANEDGRGDRDISAADAPVRAVLVRAREDLVIAREVASVLSAPPA